ncbi:serine phosphatase RsbU (regulator of sigma subunit) [Jatrophihabitans sp. GAS493]|uniref:PP2C family protein-serine/threonine phosphatase n=1 Tax=Jatrophihabitans sp. GAS493 TaxID=1907575 RepID=UPI000BC038D5|nr:PP2C family protein-serine/threonine phosphatase [Jatrophihabitans sp. GAS493]SOD72265.1 serine phosphatase RsbU (regulator of sigma subunit) [Jatrophihabitans sp. GAS493]
MAPLLASSLLGPLLTAAYGGVAVLAWGGLAIDHDQFADSASTSAAYFRLGGILVGTGIAIAAAAGRQRREAQLRRVEQVAEVAQHAILAEVPERLGPIRLAARYVSSAQDATVGGDFYAAAATEHGVRVLVGDVRGKGLDAVRLAAVALGAFRERVDEESDVMALLERLSTSVTRHSKSGDFVTAILVDISGDGTVKLAVAGHPAPILTRAGEAALLELTSIRPPLGIDGAATTTTLRLTPGDQLVLYTDGATEARRPSDNAFRDEEPLLHDVATARTPAQAVDRVLEGLQAWTGGQLIDDVAVLALQFDPLASKTTDTASGTGTATGTGSGAGQLNAGRTPAG